MINYILVVKIFKVIMFLMLIWYEIVSYEIVERSEFEWVYLFIYLVKVFRVLGVFLGVEDVVRWRKWFNRLVIFVKMFLEVDDWESFIGFRDMEFIGGFVKVVFMVWWGKSLFGMWLWLNKRRELRVVSVYNYLRSCCYKKK